MLESYQNFYSLENQEILETSESISQDPPPASSSAGAYVVGGIGCGLGLISAVLCAVLFKKLSEINVSLETKKMELDTSSQKITALETQMQTIDTFRQSVQEELHDLQQNDENLMNQINDIRFNPVQSSDNSEEIAALVQSGRQQKESIEYHDSVLRQLQAAQQSVQQQLEELAQQYTTLSAMISTMQSEVQKPKPASVLEISAPVYASDVPEGDVPLTFDKMLDLLDQKYNEAVFLSISSSMAGQIDFYEDTERKAHIILIEDQCYPNPYRFVNLEKQQESYSHLSLLAPVFEMHHIVNGNVKYGLDSLVPAVLELQEDNSYLLRKKGVLNFC